MAGFNLYKIEGVKGYLTLEVAEWLGLEARQFASRVFGKNQYEVESFNVPNRIFKEIDKENGTNLVEKYSDHSDLTFLTKEGIKQAIYILQGRKHCREKDKMTNFIVTEVTEIRTTYEIEATNAPMAISRAKSKGLKNSPKQSVEQHFVARIKEEDKGE